MCVCVCVLMGGIGVLFGFKKLRRGRGHPHGPLAVIHVNSFKTSATLLSSLSLQLSQIPVSSMTLDAKRFIFLNLKCPHEAPLVILKIPQVIMIALLCDTQKPDCYCVVMSSARVNEAKIDTDMDEDKLKRLPEDSDVLSHQG